jgi:hypothetical protein
MSALHAFRPSSPTHTFFSRHISDVIVIHYRINSTTSSPFLFRKTAVINLLAGKQHLFKILGLVW